MKWVCDIFSEISSLIYKAVTTGGGKQSYVQRVMFLLVFTDGKLESTDIKV